MDYTTENPNDQKFSKSWVFTWNNYNADDELEDLIFAISKKLYTYTNQNAVFREDKLIFYDSFGFSNQGLTQQYIRAFIFNKFSFII